MIVRLSAGQHVQLEREARAALPRESCGLIEGRRDPDDLDIVALHPCRNLARSDDAFEIDPVEQFRLMRALRGTNREIIGCYHSHPNGKPEPSPRDIAAASEEGFLWLIVTTSGGVPSLGAYVRKAGALAAVSIMDQK